MTDHQTSPVGEEQGLLPCPMCGGAAKVNEMDDYYMAMCECGVNYEGPTTDDCVDSWNRRSTPAAGTVEKDAAQREAWLIENHRWSVRWRIHTKKQIEQWQMVDDGEPWGQWGEYRKVVDAAIEAHNRAGKEQG